MNRPAGQAVDAVAGSVCSADQADQVSSGSPTLPERAWNAIDVPAGLLGAPAQRAEPADELGVVDLGDEASRRGVARGEPDHRARVAGPQQERAVGLGQQREDLSGIELGDRRGLVAVVADLEELALGAGADEQAVVDPGQRVDERLDPAGLRAGRRRRRVDRRRCRPR